MSQVELTTLGKSCEFFNGKAHEKNIDENGKYIVVNSKFISQEGRVVKRTKEQMFPLYKGDIVMVMSDVPNGKALAKCFIIDKDDTYSLNQRICCIRSKEFDTNYLYYQLNRHQHFLAFNNGENQTNLRKDDILACPLIKPSIEEQKRMVDELDLAFLNLGKAITNTEKNFLNSRELFESFLNGIFIENVDWENKQLKELTTKIGSGATPRGGQESYKSEGISLVRSMNVHDWEFRDTNLAFIDEKQAKELKGVTLQENDVLLNITGASVARCCVFPKEYLPARVNQHVSIIRPKKEILDARFLNLLLTAKLYKNQLLFTGEQGATRQAITKAQLEVFSISFPNLKRQQTIVQQLYELQTETQKLEEKYQKKIYALEELKSGIIKRAFEKELIEAE